MDGYLVAFYFSFLHIWVNKFYIALVLQSMQGIINSIVRPTMSTYSIPDLGPKHLKINHNSIKRTDVIVQSIPVSYYQVQHASTTIVYAHSYNSNQLEATSITTTVLQHHISLVSFDFQRVVYNEDSKKVHLNHKEGYISFGFYENEQLQIVIKWLRTKVKGKILIWGRSMGAVCALLYQSKSQQCDGLILDSPFHSLKQTFVNQISHMSPLPRFMSHSVVFICNQYFKKLLKFDLSQLDILKHLKIKCPVFIIVNPKDPLTGQSSKLIYDKCQGYRKLYFSEAEHSGSRENFIIDDILANIKTFQTPIINKYLIKQKQGLKITHSNSNAHFPYYKTQSESLQKAKTKMRFLKIYQSTSPRQKINVHNSSILATQQKQTFYFCSE